MAPFDRNPSQERQQIQEISLNVARRLFRVVDRARFAAPAAIAAEIESTARVISGIQRDVDQLMAALPPYEALDISVLTHVLGTQQHALGLLEHLESKTAGIAPPNPTPDQGRTHAALLATARDIEQEAQRYAVPLPSPPLRPALPPPAASRYAPPQSAPGPRGPAPTPPASSQRRPAPPPGAPPVQRSSKDAVKKKSASQPADTPWLALLRGSLSKPGPASMLSAICVGCLVIAVWKLLPAGDARFVSQASTAAEQGPKLDGRLASSEGGETQTATSAPPMTFTTANAAPAMEQPYLVVLATRRSTDELQKAFMSYRETYPKLLGGSKARVDRIQGQDRQTWYRLSVIPPQARDDAKALCSGLRQAGLAGCWIKPVPLN